MHLWSKTFIFCILFENSFEEHIFHQATLFFWFMYVEQMSKIFKLSWRKYVKKNKCSYQFKIVKECKMNILVNCNFKLHMLKKRTSNVSVWKIVWNRWKSMPFIYDRKHLKWIYDCFISRLNSSGFWIVEKK